MATITTRSGKGSPLTNSEVDSNFTNLNTDKVELDDISVGANASASGSGGLAYANSTGVFTYTPPDLSGYLTSYTVTQGDVTQHQAALSITESQISDFGTYLKNLSEDTSPQLGGNLDVNGHDIVTTSNADIELDPNGSGVVVFKGNSTKGSGQFKLNCETNSHAITIKGPPHSANASYTLTLPNDDGDANQVLKTDGSGNLSWVAQAAAGASVTPSATAPGSPSDGDLWFSETNGVTYVYYNDGNSSQWVASGTPSASVAGSTTLDGLTDTTLGTPANGDVLAYNSSTSKWESTGSAAEADNWQSAGYQLNGAALTGTWNRIGSYVGTGMSVSSGVFTFPSTGLYKVTADFEFVCFSSATQAAISITQNNGASWGNTATVTGTEGSNNYDKSNGSSTIIFDVTNTSTHKVRIYGVSASSGDSVTARLYFQRLSDT